MRSNVNLDDTSKTRDFRLLRLETAATVTRWRVETQEMMDAMQKHESAANQMAVWQAAANRSPGHWGVNSVDWCAQNRGRRPGRRVLCSVFIWCDGIRLETGWCLDYSRWNDECFCLLHCSCLSRCKMWLIDVRDSGVRSWVSHYQDYPSVGPSTGQDRPHSPLTSLTSLSPWLTLRLWTSLWGNCFAFLSTKHEQGKTYQCNCLLLISITETFKHTKYLLNVYV